MLKCNQNVFRAISHLQSATTTTEGGDIHNIGHNMDIVMSSAYLWPNGNIVAYSFNMEIELHFAFNLWLMTGS